MIVDTEEQNAPGTVYDTVRDDDGNPVSSRAVTTDAGGNVVGVVERTFDDDGNVTSATYTDHRIDPDTGQTTTELTEYGHGLMVEESSTITTGDGVVIEMIVTTFDAHGDRDTTEAHTYDAGGAPIATTSIESSDAGRPMRTTRQVGAGRAVVSHGRGVHTRTTTGVDGTVTEETLDVDDTGAVTSRTIEVTEARDAEPARAVTSVAPTGAGAGHPVVAWTRFDDTVDGITRELTGYSDGSILISSTSTAVFGVGGASRTEHIFPDGTRVVTKPIDKSVIDGRGLDVGSLATFEEMWAGAGDVTLSYGPDGTLTAAEWFRPQGSGGVGGEVVVVVVVAEPIAEEPSTGPTGALAVPLGSSTTESGATRSFQNRDGTTVETTTFSAGDVAFDQQICEADGTVRSITHFNDGSVALTDHTGGTERIHRDGTIESAVVIASSRR